MYNTVYTVQYVRFLYTIHRILVQVILYSKPNERTQRMKGYNKCLEVARQVV